MTTWRLTRQTNLNFPIYSIADPNYDVGLNARSWRRTNETERVDHDVASLTLCTCQGSNPPVTIQNFKAIALFLTLDILGKWNLKEIESCRVKEKTENMAHHFKLQLADNAPLVPTF